VGCSLDAHATYKMPVWYYDKKELKNSPSTQSGLTYEEETRYRREGARFIQELGKSLGLRHDTMATASVYFHRFYMFHSFLEFSRYVTATCTLFLAGKAEETPKKCRDIMKTVKELLNLQQFSSFGQDPREEVMTLERVLLQTIKFDLSVDHPYSSLLKYAKCLKGDNAKLQKMVQMSWTFVNDSLCTTLCLQWEPEVIAIALMYLAAKLSKFEVKDWKSRTEEHQHWWDQYVKHLSTDILEDICHQVLDLYSTPHTNAKEAPPSPPPGQRILQPKPTPRTPAPPTTAVVPAASTPAPPLSKPPQQPPKPPSGGSSGGSTHHTTSTNSSSSTSSTGPQPPVAIGAPIPSTQQPYHHQSYAPVPHQMTAAAVAPGYHQQQHATYYQTVSGNVAGVGGGSGSSIAVAATSGYTAGGLTSQTAMAATYASVTAGVASSSGTGGSYAVPPPSGFLPTGAPPARPPAINGPPAMLGGNHPPHHGGGPPPGSRSAMPDTRAPPPSVGHHHHPPSAHHNPPPSAHHTPHHQPHHQQQHHPPPPHDMRGPPPDLRGPPPDHLQRGGNGSAGVGMPPNTNRSRGASDERGGTPLRGGLGGGPLPTTPHSADKWHPHRNNSNSGGTPNRDMSGGARPPPMMGGMGQSPMRPMGGGHRPPGGPPPYGGSPYGRGGGQNNRPMPYSRPPQRGGVGGGQQQGNHMWR